MKQLTVERIALLADLIKDTKFKIRSIQGLAQVCARRNKPFWMAISERLAQETDGNDLHPSDHEIIIGGNCVAEDSSLFAQLWDERQDLPSVLRQECFYSQMGAIVRAYLDGHVRTDHLARVQVCESCNCQMRSMVLNSKQVELNKSRAVQSERKQSSPDNGYTAAQTEINSAALLSLLMDPGDVLRMCSLMEKILTKKLKGFEKDFLTLTGQNYEV